MSSNLGHIAATASLNIDPFQQSARVTQTQIRSLDKALKAQEQAFKGSGKSINDLKAVYDQTGRSITSYTALLDKQKERYNALKNEIGDFDKANAEQKKSLLGAEAAMNTTAGKLEELTGKYSKLGQEIIAQERNLAIQGASWTQASKQLESFGKTASAVGKELSTIGGAMTKGLTLPIVGGVGLAVKAAIDFESAFAGVNLCPL